MLVELDDVLVEVPGAGAERAEVRVVGEVDRWFDAIDFATLSGDDVGRALLIALAASTVVEVQIVEDDAG